MLPVEAFETGKVFEPLPAKAEIEHRSNIENL
jgi:hypothetical protein